MNCFSFPSTDKRASDSKSKRITSSVGSTTDGGKSVSDMNSMTTSGPESHPSTPRRNLQSFSQRPQNLRVFTYEELRGATKNFHRSNMLGEGGFGCVYKGWITHSQSNEEEVRMEVAVKQLNRKGHQGHKEWLAEVHFLGLVEHPNLVKLVGYCAEDDERGIQRLLVYEFMPNRSLEEHLFWKGLPVLPWNERMDIALGAACGLAYLHEEIDDLQVIFRDFKTSNVLLDKEFKPKLSDFGLARQGPETGASHVSTAVVGTIGYAAPEYLQTGHLTLKSDVYSFGVVLLEMLSGRRSVDRNRPKSEQRLLEWAKPYLLDNRKFHLLMDPRLENQFSLEKAMKVASLAQHCLAKNPRNRPKMSAVVNKLKQIIDMSKEEVAVRSSSTRSETIETLIKEPRKEPNSTKRKFQFFGEGNSNSKEERPTWLDWIPKLIKA